MTNCESHIVEHSSLVKDPSCESSQPFSKSSIILACLVACLVVFEEHLSRLDELIIRRLVQTTTRQSVLCNTTLCAVCAICCVIYAVSYVLCAMCFPLLHVCDGRVEVLKILKDTVSAVKLDARDLILVLQHTIITKFTISAPLTVVCIVQCVTWTAVKRPPVWTAGTIRPAH